MDLKWVWYVAWTNIWERCISVLQVQVVFSTYGNPPKMYLVFLQLVLLSIDDESRQVHLFLAV